MRQEKAGSVELLRKIHLAMKNPWDHPVVGWLPVRDGIGGLFNARGIALLRVVVNKRLQNAEEMQPLYDQPIIVENVGAVVIAQLNGRIGLVQNFRMVGERLLPHAGSNYIRDLQQKKLWRALLASLGEYRWEAPRGSLPEHGESELNAFILKTAHIEALQESGFRLASARIVGSVNPNSTFFPHALYVVHAQIESLHQTDAEDLEILGNTKLFTLEELRELNNKGEFDCGFTLAALALCGISLPPNL